MRSSLEVVGRRLPCLDLVSPVYVLYFPMCTFIILDCLLHANFNFCIIPGQLTLPRDHLKGTRFCPKLESEIKKLYVQYPPPHVKILICLL